MRKKDLCVYSCQECGNWVHQETNYLCMRGGVVV